MTRSRKNVDCSFPKGFFPENDPAASDLARAFGMLWQNSKPSFMGRKRSGEGFHGDEKILRSNIAKPDYIRAVEKIIEYIKSGDVYQVNMSQRFEMNFSGDSFALFERLYEKNPAPFFAYVDAGDHTIVCTSPERFLLLKQNRVETRPIKGTRPRGKTLAEDRKNREDLQQSRKDDAELSMIVDLLRNDIGKVCKGRIGAGSGAQAPGALPKRVSFGICGGGRAGRGQKRLRPDSRDLSRRLHHRVSQNQVHGDHRRTGAVPPPCLHRRHRVHRLPRNHGFEHRHSHGNRLAGQGLFFRGRRNRVRLGPGIRVRGNPSQGDRRSLPS